MGRKLFRYVNYKSSELQGAQLTESEDGEGTSSLMGTGSGEDLGALDQQADRSDSGLITNSGWTTARGTREGFTPPHTIWWLAVGLHILWSSSQGVSL